MRPKHKEYTALQSRLVQAMTWYESCANEKFSGRQVAQRLERVLTQTDTPEWETDS